MGSGNRVERHHGARDRVHDPMCGEIRTKSLPSGAVPRTVKEDEREMQSDGIFAGYPYLVTWLTEDWGQLTCLPVAHEEELIERARNEHQATGLDVQLVLAAARSVQIDAFGQCDRVQTVRPRFALCAPGPADAADDLGERRAELLNYCRSTLSAPLEPSDIAAAASALAAVRDRAWRSRVRVTCGRCGVQVSGTEVRPLPGETDDPVLVCTQCVEAMLSATRG